MGEKSAAVCLIASGMNARNLRLQPWRYLCETANQLHSHSHEVHIISDGARSFDSPQHLSGVPIWRLHSISNPRWGGNGELCDVVRKLNPSVLLWHMGLTSILHQRFALPGDVPVIGIFTSPIYGISELLRLGLPKLVAGYRLSSTHLLGTLLPKFVLRRCLALDNPRQIVVQSETLAAQLRRTGVWRGPISVIPPGVDVVWNSLTADVVAATRAKLGYAPTDKVLVYFGSPAPLRGLHTLLHAYALARQNNPSLKLLVLSRRRVDELLRQDAVFRRLLQEKSVAQHVQVISGFLPEEELAAHVAAADIVTLPFELVPSDAPLSLLEAGALQKPIISTNVGCIPELIADDTRWILPPADVEALKKTFLAAASQCSHSESDRTSNEPTGWIETGNRWVELLEQVSQKALR